jgi:hypothetical protein
LNRTTTANLEKGRLSYNKFVVETWESWLKHDERSYTHYMHDRFAEKTPNSKMAGESSNAKDVERSMKLNGR